MHNPETKKLNPPKVNKVTAVLYKFGWLLVYSKTIVPIK